MSSLDPTNSLSGISSHDSERLYVASHHRAGSDYGAFANVNTFEYNSPTTDENIVTYMDLIPRMWHW